MTNNKPFKILLDHHDYECFMLYSMLRTLLGYPAIDFGSDENEFDVKGKLYASAFAYICSNYLVDYTQMYPHEDFELFVHDMKFMNDRKELITIAKKHDVNIDQQFHKIVSDLLAKIRKEIVVGIKKLFPSDDHQLCLFGSIFEMGATKGYQPSFSLYEEHPGLFFLR